ncbi:uncharacterized protein K444DRAFT_308397 [Hyaloscypha bicolor E]|uniref:Uncharacterized protein n=1 Tax=Hyaloscypha bicolor E TaxID=1095630 RepID=A0A2J6TMT6_9HELO|nr:uncharacterized protein K444DRAFT_308397 [Hyaloscypha bicolor E]PMD64278.1 hypothetical protein K444DRAFT_308397 [Hyaloscypha bicolor E]
MFLMDWDHFEDFVKFPLHDTAKSEAISPEADEADPAICGDDYSAGTGVDAMKTAGDNKQGKEGNYSLELEDLLKDIDFNSTTDSGPTHQIEDLKNWPLEGKTPEKEHKHSDADQKARELEGIQRRIERQAAREKAMARAKEAMHKMTNSAEPSASGPEKDFPNDPTKQQGSQKTGAAGDSTLVQRCIQSAIPSIAATTGTDILETINLDLLNEHFDLNIDLSDAWQRLLKPGAIAENIKAYLEECATDPYAWNILKREGHFKLNLWRVTRAYGEDGNRRNTNREYLIAILETLRKILEKDVEWEIVPDRVPRAVMRMAIAVAKEGPNPPGIDVGDEDFQIGSSEPVTCT